MKSLCAFLLLVVSNSLLADRSVSIYHLIDNALWGEVDGSAVQGVFRCFDNENATCQIFSSDCKSNHFKCLQNKFIHRLHKSALSNDIIVALYNIHTWGLYSSWPHAPSPCYLPAHLSMVESEESHSRFSKLFVNSFMHFHGNSTTSPTSTIQRKYFSGWNPSHLLPLSPHSKLINGTSFVASNCHRNEPGTTQRVSVVIKLQNLFRVDSLGKCIHTKHIAEGIVLQRGKTALESLLLKQHAISHYLFYCAFENTYERGYVTEKVFDALIAGVVPIYLGSSVDCKALLPDPKAAIFLDDFNQDINKLATYLSYLSINESAYEEHRSWRKQYQQQFNKNNNNISVNNLSVSPVPQQEQELFTKSWPCKICEWAVTRSAATEQTKLKKEQKVASIHSTVNNWLTEYSNLSINNMKSKNCRSNWLPL